VFVLVGFALMRALVPGGRRFCRHDFWRVLLGSGLGVGVSSLAFLAWLQFGVPELALEAILLAVLVWVAWRSQECRLCTIPARPWSRLDYNIALTFALTATVAVIAFLRQTNSAPHGHWDAWAIHNLHARFLVDRAAWHDLFSPLIPFTHPDYPLLLPGFVASWWTLLGNQSTAVPAATAALFTFGTAGLLVSSLTMMRSPQQGLLAGLVLIAVPNFIAIGAGQIADVPLGWFLLAATVLLVADYPAAAGVAAGFAAWTKNDGAMLFVAIVIAWGLARQWTLRRLRDFGLGAFVPLAVMIWFKLTLAPVNPERSMANAWEYMTDASRYVTVALGFVRHVWAFGGLIVSPFLFLLAYAALMRSEKAYRGSVRATALTLVLAVCGYFAVYIFSVYDPLVGLIDSSLDRLLIQLWPTAVFLVFLAARSIEPGLRATHIAIERSPNMPALTRSTQIVLVLVLACLMFAFGAATVRFLQPPPSDSGTAVSTAPSDAGDLPVPGDYDGDGQPEVALFRASNGNWSIRNSSTGALTTVLWGGVGDVVVPGDYDGDHRSDVAVFRPSNGTWYIRSWQTGLDVGASLGMAGDVPVPADYDRDGKTDMAVFRPSTATWHIRNSSTGVITTVAYPVKVR